MVTTDAGHTPSTATAADTYALVFPASWRELPLDPDGYRSVVQDTITALLADTDPAHKRTTRRQVELFFRGLRVELDRGRVLLAGAFIDPLSEDEATQAGEVLTVSCALSALERTELSAPVPLRAASLARAMRGTSTRSTAGGRSIDLQPPEVVTLPAGEAVRLVRVEEAREGVITLQRSFVETFLVPHDEGERVGVLQFSTPNLPFARELSALFAAIARSLRILHPDEATSLEPVVVLDPDPAPDAADD